MHIKTEYVCPKEGCLYKCKSGSTFKEHTKYYHLKKKTVKCKSQGCQLLFKMPIDMYQHMRTYHC